MLYLQSFVNPDMTFSVYSGMVDSVLGNVPIKHMAQCGICANLAKEAEVSAFSNIQEAS
jgi:hypothetical protein